MTSTEIIDATLKADVFFTPSELSKRWRGEVTVKTLAQWRSRNFGPAYYKVGNSVLYAAADILNWEQGQIKGQKERP